MKTTRGWIWLFVAFLAAPISNAVADGKAATPQFRKVLVLGNSITWHGPKHDIGWTGNWGMAASAQDKDFAHLVVRGVGEAGGAAPEAMIKNISEFERQYASYDVAAKLKDEVAFGADLIILAIGENVPALDSDEAKLQFSAALKRLLSVLTGERHPTLVVRSCFWPNAAKDAALERACREAGGIYVDIGHLAKDESNYARSERSFEHKGVAAHPGDKGMRAIADAILAAVKRSPTVAQAAPRMKLGAYYFAGWSGKSPYDDGSVSNVWAKGMPTHFTKKLATEFAGRTPVWGWRDDTPELMERQIALAADHGISYFSFCWYWHDNKQAINTKGIEEDSKHLPMRLFMDAKNNGRMEFCLLVANHRGAEIDGPDAWKQAADYWIANYFKHPRYLRSEGKPVIMIFSPKGADKAGLAYLQEASKKAGFPGVWVAGCGNVTAEQGYQIVTAYNTKPAGLGLEEIYPFKLLADWNVSVWNRTDRPPLPYIPVATQGWDRRPWEAKHGEGLGKGSGVSSHFARGTPEELERYMGQMVAWMDARPDRATKDRLALIYAWNEIGEGGWLVPCKDDPDGAYLKAIRRAVLGK